MRKKTLLLERRSLSPLSSAVPGARQGLPPSLPRDTTEPPPAAAAQNHGPPAPRAAEGLGDPRSGAHPQLCTSKGHPSIQLPATISAVLCLPLANPKGWPWDRSQPQPKGHGRASTERQASSGWRARGHAGVPSASSLSSPMEGPGSTTSPGLLPGAWTGSKAQSSERASVPRTPSSTYLDFGLPWIRVCKHNRGTDSVSVAVCWNKGKI